MTTKKGEMMVDEDKGNEGVVVENTEPESLEQAMGLAIQEAEAEEKEEEGEKAPPSSEEKEANEEQPASAEAPSEDKKETDDGPPKADFEGVDAWPEDMREKYEERIKGYQAAWTKGRQSDKASVDNLRKEYEEKFQAAVGQLRGDKPQQAADGKPKSSLKDFYPEGDASQLDQFEQALNAMIESRMAPVLQENQALKQAYTQDKQQASIQSEWSTLASKYSLAESFQNDMVAFAQTHPESVKSQSLENIYKLMTYDAQRKAGKSAALAEIQKKEREALENNSSANTVESEEISSIEEAWAIAEKEMASRDKR